MGNGALTCSTNTKVSTTFLTRASEIGPGGLTLLHIAALQGSLEDVQLLLENRANVNAASHDGWTPLHVATEQGHRGCVQALIQHGADVNSITNKGQTPLHIGAHNGEFR